MNVISLPEFVIIIMESSFQISKAQVGWLVFQLAKSRDILKI